jgi:Txe/YoeB family toxin of Txe-Axe toxin-antitoxin module
MKKKTDKRKSRDELRGEYDFSKLKGGVRGKYSRRYQAGTNLVLLSPDVAKFFPDEQSVNTALRMLIRSSKGSRRSTR